MNVEQLPIYTKKDGEYLQVILHRVRDNQSFAEVTLVDGTKLGELSLRSFYVRLLKRQKNSSITEEFIPYNSFTCFDEFMQEMLIEATEEMEQEFYNQ